MRIVKQLCVNSPSKIEGGIKGEYDTGSNYICLDVFQKKFILPPSPSILGGSLSTDIESS